MDNHPSTSSIKPMWCAAGKAPLKQLAIRRPKGTGGGGPQKEEKHTEKPGEMCSEGGEYRKEPPKPEGDGSAPGLSTHGPSGGVQVSAGIFSPIARLHMRANTET
ncbi:hypothetical protein FS749_000901 [Ceratobasidium sp. UAMH 11750]|nr:hypothetical protein FS749_000901 [Ceratobasidium sp. UAMH 11750]